MSNVTTYIGGDSFREFMTRHRTYVDKTGLIEELLASDQPQVSLITRPRRFGKTLALSMLKEFFAIEGDSAALFAGLSVSNNKALCAAWMNAFPVIFLTLKEMKKRCFQSALAELAETLVDICIEHKYLLSSPRVDEDDRTVLARLKAKEYSETLLSSALQRLCRALKMHWEKPVIVLIDEYDAPIEAAYVHGFYEEMIDFMRSFLGRALKSAAYLQCALLTGCLRIAKESIFTGINNFACYTLDDDRFSDKFGFTETEVCQLLEKGQCSDKQKIVKEWYDGYRFGRNTEIYCPWDIMNYLYDLQQNPDISPKPYWMNTSGNDIIRNYFGVSDRRIRKKIESLINAGSVEATIVDTCTYDTLKAVLSLSSAFSSTSAALDISQDISTDALWSMLYFTGYLTKRKTTEERAERSLATRQDETSFRKHELVLPNKEIQEICVRYVDEWFEKSVQMRDNSALFTAFWQGDAKVFTEEMNALLSTRISYYSYKESYYHGFLTGLFGLSEFEVCCEREAGLGRLDMFVEDEEHGRVAIIELKRAERQDLLPLRAEEAVEQIRSRRYDEVIGRKHGDVLCWGMAFWKKRCVSTCCTFKN